MARFLVFLLGIMALIVGSAWYWVVENPMFFFDHEYPIAKAKGDILNACNIGPIVFLGDSRTLASVIPDKIGASVVNLGIGGASLLDLPFLSRRILACPTPPKAIILSMAFNNFDDQTCFWDRTVRFNVLNVTLSDLARMRRFARRMDDQTVFGTPSPFDIDARLRSFLGIIKFPSYYFGAMINGRLGQREQMNKEIYYETIMGKGHHFMGFNNGSWYVEPFTKREHFKLTPFYASFLDETLKLYQKQGIPVYYIGPPYKVTDMELLSPVVRKEFTAVLRDYEKRFSNFHVIGEPFMTLPNIVFSDGGHVNPKGAMIWSDHLSRVLNKNKILQ